VPRKSCLASIWITDFRYEIVGTPGATDIAPQFPARQSKIPHDSEAAENRECGKVNVNLPPAKSMTSRIRTAVVVMVPSIAEREEGNKEIVSTVVSAVIRVTAVAMANRICRPNSMIHAHLADCTTPNNELKTIRTAMRSVPCLTIQI
jgi:hypothetical protein